MSTSKSCYLYVTKFISRAALDYLKYPGTAPAVEFTSVNNLNGYPELRYAEVLLNWIEAKAELETLGQGAVSQEDIDLSINQIRSRPIAQEAVQLGVKATEPMVLTALPNDPARDKDVPALLWEIRRERRMEFAFEHSRIIDLCRWKKLEYMDTDANDDLLTGTWVDFPTQCPGDLKNDNKGKLRVKTAKAISSPTTEPTAPRWSASSIRRRISVGSRSWASPTSILPYACRIQYDHRLPQQGLQADSNRGLAGNLN